MPKEAIKKSARPHTPNGGLKASKAATPQPQKGGAKKKGSTTEAKERTASDKKKHAYMLFVESGHTLKDIAEMLGINKNTLTNWNLKEDWEGQRVAMDLSPQKLIRWHYEEAQRIRDAVREADRPMTASEADALLKLTTSIQKLDKTASISIVQQVLSNFGKWLATQDLALIKEVMPFQNEYVQTLIDATK